ncbi:MAG: hypothetical protein II627_02030 [Lachnospiraceae bacterium]|nr:hypothetical protein [Lachnospiraceae bacterium]
MRLRRHISRGKKLVRNVTDLVSILCVCLLPVLIGGVFFKVLSMGGAPVWFYVICGIFFVICLSQTIYFFLAGLIGAVRGRDFSEQESVQADQEAAGWESVQADQEAAGWESVQADQEAAGWERVQEGVVEMNRVSADVQEGAKL